MFGKLMAELKQRYDYVFIDTPPMANVVDAAVVGRVCDGAVIVIEWKRWIPCSTEDKETVGKEWYAYPWSSTQQSRHQERKYYSYYNYGKYYKAY